MSFQNFPLSSSLLSKLIAHNYTPSHILTIKPSILSSDLKITNIEALEIINIIRNGSVTSIAGIEIKNLDNKDPTFNAPNSLKCYNSTVNAAELLKSERVKSNIITMCEELDNILGGGIKYNTLTEFYGIPGIGKTQLGIQLSCNVQIPKIFGGSQKKAIYIDTEGSFIPERAEDMAKSLIKHLNLMCDSKSSMLKLNIDEVRKTLNELTVESILTNINVFRILDSAELCSIIKHLFKYLKETDNEVGLIVIDSIAFHFRGEIPNYNARQKMLQTISMELNQLATEFNTAIVIMNQVTTKPDAAGKTQVIAALGDTWAHVCSTRIFLTMQNEQRIARLVKSSFLKEATARFDINQMGIRKATNQSLKRKSPEIEQDSMTPATN